MTVWRARLVKHEDSRLDALGRRIFCGRAERGRFCPQVIGWVVDELRDGLAGYDIIINHGLTDAGTPGHYRWSTTAKERIAHGRVPDILGRAQGGGGRFARGPRQVRVPVTLPCAQYHDNLVDEAVLLG